MDTENPTEDLLSIDLSMQSSMDLEFDKPPTDPVFKFMNGEISFNDYLKEMEEVNDTNDVSQVEIVNEPSTTVTLNSPIVDEEMDDLSDVSNYSPSSSESEEDFETIKVSEKSKPGRKKSQKCKRSKLSPTLRALMGQANVCYAKGDTQAAVKMCLEIIKEAPEASEPFKTLASIYDEMGEHEKSLQMKLIAAHLGPASKEEWVELAQVLKRDSQFRQAVICLTRAINMDDMNLSLYEERAETFKKAGVTCVEAYGYPRLLFKLDPKKHGPTILYLCKKVAQIYYSDKKYEKTINTLKYAFDNCPDLITVVEANLYLDVLCMTHDYEECLDVLMTFCNVKFSFKTVGDQRRVCDCTVPDDLPIDIRAKLIITLISTDSLPCVIKQIDILLSENPDEAGDLFWDVGLRLCEKEKYEEAIRVLVPLVNTQNFNTISLWFKLTQCYKETNRIEECHQSYRKALEYYPDDNDLKLKFCDELIAAQKYQEAVEVTKSDENDISLLIYERCKLYLLLEDDDNFLESGWQLFRLHCKVIKSSEDYVLYTSVSTSTKGIQSFLAPYVPSTVDTSVSLDEEWKIFVKMCEVYMKRKEYDMLLLLTVSLHVSLKFIPMRRELKMSMIVACFLNNNYELGFDVIRDIIHHKKINTNRMWNTLHVCTLKTEYNRLHKFLIRYLKSHSDEDRAVMMYANDSLFAGTYKYALNDHSILFQKYNHPLLAFLVGIDLLHISCQKYTSNKHALVSQTMAFFSKYKSLRGDEASQEVYYNIGRLFHHLHLLSQAIFYYKKALDCSPAVNDGMFDLKCDIGYNLHLIYLYSNQPKIANMYLQKYVVI